MSVLTTREMFTLDFIVRNTNRERYQNRTRVKIKNFFL